MLNPRNFISQIVVTLNTAAVITCFGVLGVQADVNSPLPAQATNPSPETITRPSTYPAPPHGWEIKTISGKAEISLVQYLTKIGSKMYGAWWCPHCYDQKQLFGAAAAKDLPYIECDPKGINPQTELCIANKIKGFPTWIINGKTYSGTRDLKDLAQYAGYDGPSNFRYTENRPSPTAASNVITKPTTYPVPPHGWEIKTISGQAEISLAEYLTKIGAKMYGAWWCPHCFDQKQLFGAAAAKDLPYTECDPKGINPQTKVCTVNKVESYPTWVIKGKTYSGATELQELAKYSGYNGPSNFKYKER